MLGNNLLAVCSGGAAAATLPPDSLLVHMKLNGNIANSVAGGPTPYNTGATPVFVGGELHCKSLGTYSHISYDHTMPTSFSFGFEITRNGTNKIYQFNIGDYHISFNTEDSSYGYANRIAFWQGGTIRDFSTNLLPSIGTKFHVFFVVESGVGTHVYINGVFSETMDVFNAGSTNHKLFHNISASYPLDSYIDDYILYGRYVASLEVEAIYAYSQAN